jgi:hypothetical protein
VDQVLILTLLLFDLMFLLIVHLIEILNVIGVDRETIINALKIGLKDFEDSIQVSASQFFALDCIITRNKVDFEKSDFKVYTPNEYLLSNRN